MRKQSTQILWQSVCHSWAIALISLAGIVGWNAGPTAVFAAIIAASSGLLLVRYVAIARDWGRPRYSRQILAELWSYGWPVIINGLLMNLMYQIGRWFLKELLSLEQVGLLSLGLQIADKVNRMIVMPFQGIWTTLIYELHSEHPARAVRTYCVVYELFCYVLISVFFGCSIAAGPALAIIARPEYLPSVPLIPILCLAQFCLAAGDQFQTPMRLKKQTLWLIPSAVMGVAMAWLMNSRLIPIYGVYGAAWATVATYASFSAVSLLVSRQLEIYPYPFHRIGLVLAGVCATYVAVQTFAAQFESGWAALGISLAAWCGWTLVMALLAYRNVNRRQPDDD